MTARRGGDIDLCVLAMPRHRFGNALAGAVRIL